MVGERGRGGRGVVEKEGAALCGEVASYGSADAFVELLVSDVTEEGWRRRKGEKGPRDPPVMMANLPSRGLTVKPPVRFVEKVLWRGDCDSIVKQNV